MKMSFLIFVLAFFVLMSCRDNAKTVHSSVLNASLDASDSLPAAQRQEKLDSIFTVLADAENDSVHRSIMIKVAGKYYNYGDYEKYSSATRKAYAMARRKKDTLTLATALYYLGDYHDVTAQPDSAMYYYVQSEKFFRNLGDTLNTGRLTLYISGLLYANGNFPESEIKAVRALSLLTETDNTRLVYEACLQVALSLTELKNYAKALEYFDMALLQLDRLEKENYPRQKVMNSRAACYNNIGLLWEKAGEYGKAVAMYKKGLQTINLKATKPTLYAMLLNNRAFSQMKSGQVEGVYDMLLKALQIRDSLDNKPGIVSSRIRMGEYFLMKKDTAQAIRYFEEGYALSKDIGSSYDVIQSLKLLTENDSKNKAYYAGLYFKVSDSLQEAERATRDKFARIAYEADAIEEKYRILSGRIAYAAGIAAILFVFLAGLFAIYRLRAKNRELLFEQEQQKANEEIYRLMLEQQAKAGQARNDERNRIAMELHDGIVNRIFTTRFNLMQLDTAQQQLKEKLVKELESTQEEIRKVSHDLKQSFLDDESFPSVLQNLASLQPAEGPAIDLYIDKYINWYMVAGDKKLAIYRMLQEALQNVQKHSGAKNCTIAFFAQADKILIRIWDDGRGFDVQKTREGIGLKNLRDRANLFQGGFSIHSHPGKGTTLEILI